MVVHVSGVPATPTSPDGRDFRNYIASIHPKYDWRECLDVLVDISLHRSTTGEDPRTRNLIANLSMTRARLMGRVEAMEPQYVRILRSRVLVVIEVSEYLNPIRQRIEFDNILRELEDFLRHTAPGIVDPALIRTLWSLYHEILDLIIRGLLYWAVKRYHELIGMLTSSGIHHRLHDAYVQVNRRTARKIFIVVGEELCFDRRTQEDELERLLRELEDFLRHTAPGIVDPPLLRTLWSLYYDIFGLVRRGDLFRAVSTYRNLIQLLSNAGISHNLRYAYVRSTAYRYRLTRQGETIFDRWRTSTI